MEVILIQYGVRLFEALIISYISLFLFPSTEPQHSSYLKVSMIFVVDTDV